MPGTARPPLDGEQFDIVVIGGGISGVAIARECAKAGKSLLIVEQNDFGSGTTSRATRIIHGGLRYLEHGEIGLVRESLRERERLLAESPSLVRPLNFLLAMPEHSHRSALEIRFGLWLYRKFARVKPNGDSASDRRRLEQFLDRGQRWSVFSYEDAQCEYPERLIAEWLHAAGSHNATIRNHTELLAVDRRNDEVDSVLLRDRLSGDEYRVQCDWVINATGPWADSICKRANLPMDEPLVGGVRGSHILLPTFEGAPASAIYTEAHDGRPVFILPWAGQILVGTTEIRDDTDPNLVRPASSEIDYLLAAFQRVFPSVPYRITDVRAAFAGIRPLPYIDEQAPDSITRRHFLVDHKDDGGTGMISVVGGKLTTAASLARDCARAIGIDVKEPRGFVVQEGMDEQSLSRLYREMVEFARLPLASVKAIAQFFGPFATSVFNVIQQDDSMRRPICEHSDHVVGEAVYAVRREHAVTLADILLRRVPVALGPCWTDDCTRTAAERIGAALHWTTSQISYEIEAFEEEFERFFVRPAHQPTMFIR